LDESGIEAIKRQFLLQKLKQGDTLNEIKKAYESVRIVGVSEAYSSPLTLQLYNLHEKISNGNYIPNDQHSLKIIQASIKNYNPFREDVFSVGIVVLQMMMMFDQADIESLRKSKNFSIGKVIESKFINKKSNSYFTSSQINQ
jgi:hypothetical protein